MTRAFKNIIAISLASTLLVACGGKIETKPSPLPALTPTAWSEWKAPQTAAFLSWDSLNDPILSGLIKEGLANNLDMESAEQSLRASNLSFAAAQATRLPFVSTAGSASRSGQIDGSSYSSFSTSLSASYELDVWGRRGNRINSAQINLEGSEISLQSARISIAGQIADTYLNIRALDKKIALNNKSLKSANDLKNFIQARMNVGLAIRNELDRQEVQIANLESNIEATKSSRHQLVNTLAVLMGKTPGSYSFTEIEGTLIAPNKLSPATPAEVLRHRPDIKQAELSLARSYIDVDMVRTSLYPRFSLSTGASTSGGALDDLFKVVSLPWSAATSINLPILDAKARKTEVALAALGHEQVITRYKKTILGALRDVESALANQDSIARRRESLSREIASQQRVSNETREKYKAGRADAIDLLLDDNALIRIELSEVDFWRNSMSSTIGLLRAFGVDPAT